MNAEQTPRRVPGRLWAALAAALALRLALAAATEGYPYDMSCFVAWGEKLLGRRPPPPFTARAILPTTRPATCRCWRWPPLCAVCSAGTARAPWAACCWRRCPLSAMSAPPRWSLRRRAAAWAKAARPGA